VYFSVIWFCLLVHWPNDSLGRLCRLPTWKISQRPDWRVIYCNGLLHVFPTRNIVNFVLNLAVKNLQRVVCPTTRWLSAEDLCVHLPTYKMVHFPGALSILSNLHMIFWIHHWSYRHLVTMMNCLVLPHFSTLTPHAENSASQIDAANRGTTSFYSNINVCMTVCKLLC